MSYPQESSISSPPMGRTRKSDLQETRICYSKAYTVASPSEAAKMSVDEAAQAFRRRGEGHFRIFAVEGDSNYHPTEKIKKDKSSTFKPRSACEDHREKKLASLATSSDVFTFGNYANSSPKHEMVISPSSPLPEPSGRVDSNDTLSGNGEESAVDNATLSASDSRRAELESLSRNEMRKQTPSLEGRECSMPSNEDWVTGDVENEKSPIVAGKGDHCGEADGISDAPSLLDLREAPTSLGANFAKRRLKPPSLDATSIAIGNCHSPHTPASSVCDLGSSVTARQRKLLYNESTIFGHERTPQRVRTPTGSEAGESIASFNQVSDALSGGPSLVGTPHGILAPADPSGKLEKLSEPSSCTASLRNDDSIVASPVAQRTPSFLRNACADSGDVVELRLEGLPTFMNEARLKAISGSKKCRLLRARLDENLLTHECTGCATIFVMSSEGARGITGLEDELVRHKMSITKRQIWPMHATGALLSKRIPSTVITIDSS